MATYASPLSRSHEESVGAARVDKKQKDGEEWGARVQVRGAPARDCTSPPLPTSCRRVTLVCARRPPQRPRGSRSSRQLLALLPLEASASSPAMRRCGVLAHVDAVGVFWELGR